MNEHEAGLLYAWYWSTVYVMSAHIQKGRTFAYRYLDDNR